MSVLQVNACAEEVERIVVEYFEPLAEDGTMSDLIKRILAELTPFAVNVARRVFAERFPIDDDVVFARLSPFLHKLRRTFDGINLNPDMMAVAADSQREILEAINELDDWIYFVTRRPAASPEATVHPSADAVHASGGAV